MTDDDRVHGGVSGDVSAELGLVAMKEDFVPSERTIMMFTGGRSPAQTKCVVT